MKLAKCLLLVVVLASCSGSSGSEAVPPATSFDVTAVVPTAPSTSVSLTTTEPEVESSDTEQVPTTTSESVICSESSASTPGAGGAVLADVDGDAIEDAVTVCGAENSEEWRLWVEYGSGCTAEVSFERDLFFGIAPYIYSVFDIEGDGSMEVFLANGGGAHTEAIYLFDVQPCEVVAIVNPEDPDYWGAFLLDYGATSVGGLACDNGELRHIWAFRDDLEGPFDVDIVTYQLEGDSLVQISHIEQTLGAEDLTTLYDPPCRQAG